MIKRLKFISVLCSVVALSGSLNAYEPKRPTCIAPAKPGGGFDLTCRLVSNSIGETKMIQKPMLVSFMPGGIGAVAYNYVIWQRPKDGDTIIAASSGSALNIAQGKYGAKNTVNSVKWVGALGTDYGIIVVKNDAKWQNLSDLIADLKKDPKSITFGAGGSVGSQDWFKIALVAKMGGINPKDMKYVAFEGGGETQTALLGGHINVASGDASEMVAQIDSGKYRILAVLSEERLPGKLNDVKTAKEQGFDIVWHTWRGYYMGPKTSDEAYNFWVDTFKKLSATKEFAKERELRGLFPFIKLGKEYQDFMNEEVKRFTELAKDTGLL